MDKHTTDLNILLGNIAIIIVICNVLQGIELRLGETESETDSQVAVQRQVYSDLQEQITLDISEAVEQYQAMIGIAVTVEPTHAITNMYTFYDKCYTPRRSVTLL